MVHRGFTLIELMVSIAIIGVLLSLSAPALHSTMDAARQQQCLATLRGVGQASYVWATDHNDLLPYTGTPGQRYETDPRTGFTRDWFHNATAWTVALPMGGYIDKQATMCPWHSSLDSESLRAHPLDDRVPGSNYTLSSALYTNWAMWRHTDPAQTDDQLRPVHLAEIAHPSNKSMYIEYIPFHLLGFDSQAYNTVALPGEWGRMRHGVNTVLVDGSGRSPKINTLSSGPRAPDAFITDPDHGDEIHPFPLTTTVDGFLGRDF